MAYSAGTAFLQIVPSFKGVERAIRAQVADMGRQVEKTVSDALPAGMAEGAKRARNEGHNAGDNFSGAFATTLRQRLDKAFKALPAMQIKADSSETDKALERIRRTLKEVRDQHIGLEIDDKTALAAVAKLRAELKELNRDAVTVPVRTNTAAALKELDGVADLYNRHLQDRLGRTGQQAGDRFAEEFRKRVQAAEKNFAVLSVRATTADADEAIDKVRRELRELGHADIGIDINDAQAVERVDALLAKLRLLRDQSVDVRFKTNADGAIRELEKLGLVLHADAEEARRLDGKKINVDVDTRSAQSNLNNLTQKLNAPLNRFGALISVGAALGPAIVPSIAAAAGAIGFLGTAAGAALSGVGVVALGLSGIADAVKALDGYQNDANKSAKSLGASQNAVANAMDGVTGAQRALSRAREDAGFEAKRSAQSVEAARRQETRAERDAVSAQKDLADAIKAVKQEEEDRTLQLRDNALAQRQATLDVAAAKKELDTLLANPRATKEELEQARITYSERQLQFDKLSVSQKRLQSEQDDFNKTGVNGTEKVVAAQQRVADSQQAIADSHQSLANAIEDQKRSQKASAEAVLSATENLRQAQRTLAQSYTAAGAAGGDALDTLKEKMALLGPAGQRFAKFIFGLKDDFKSLRDAAQANLLPGLQTAIENLLPALPKVRDYIAGVAKAIGGIAVQVVDTLGNPGWTKFFSFIAEQTVPTLQLMTTVTLNVAAGARDLFLALTAFNQPIGEGLVKLTQNFATWASQLESSQGYRKFLDYVRENGPRVLEFFISLGTAVVHIIEAAAPVGAVVLRILDAIVSFIAKLPIGVLTPIIGGLAIFATVALGASAAINTVNLIVDTGRSVLKVYNATLGQGVTAYRNWSRAQDSFIIGSGAYSKGLGLSTTATNTLSTAQETAAVKTAAMATATNALGANQEAAAVKTTTMTTATKAVTVAQVDAAVATEALTTSQGPASTAARTFGGEVESLGGKAGTASRLLGGLTSFLGGPWGVATLGAGVALSFLLIQQQKEQAATEANVKSFADLGEAIRRTGSIQSDDAKATILHSDALSKMTLDMAGITRQAGDFDKKLADVARSSGNVQQAQILADRSARDYATDNDTLAKALIGNKAAQDQLLTTLRTAEQAAAQAGGDKKLALEAKARREELEKLFAQTDLQSRVETQLQKTMSASGGVFADASSGLKTYADALSVLADKSSTASEKNDALRQSEDALFGARRTQQEALEAQQRAMRDREKLLKDDNFLNQEGAKTLDTKTEAGARLTDAIEAELTAADDTYRANIAAGKSIEEATKQHDLEVQAIKDSITKKGIDATATQNLIDIYGKVPTSRITEFGTSNFGTTKDQLDELMAYQLALREGITLQQARDKIHPDIRSPGGQGNSRGSLLASGGPVRGPGTGTSDSVPAYVPGSPIAFRLSNGEFVQQAAAVDFYGQGVMQAINQRRIPKRLFDMIGYYAEGGVVGMAPPQTYPFPLNTGVSRIPSKDEVAKAVRESMGAVGPGPGFLPWPSSPMAQRGDTGVWKSILSLVRSSGIPYEFGNAYRAGDPLWHGSGRAVDFMGYNQDTLAQFFLDRLPHVLELIHLTPKSGYFVTRGVRKDNFPVQGPLHRNHLHIAMASGGPVAASPAAYAMDRDLPPGWSTALTAGRPDRVLRQQDLADLALASKQAAGGGNAYHFQFRDTTLDVSRLRAMQDREAVYARTGRAR